MPEHPFICLSLRSYRQLRCTCFRMRASVYEGSLYEYNVYMCAIFPTFSGIVGQEALLLHIQIATTLPSGMLACINAQAQA